MQSLQRRFFGVKRGFSEKEIAFFMNIDFSNHVALVALADEDGRPVIIGGGRYIVVEPGRAEIAFVVIDSYQGQGIGTLLMRHLAGDRAQRRAQRADCRRLAENTAMRKVFSKFGFKPAAKRGARRRSPGDAARLRRFDGRPCSLQRSHGLPFHLIPRARSAADITVARGLVLAEVLHGLGG